MWYKIKRVRAPTLWGLGLLVSLVLALAAGVLLMAPSPAASATNPPGEGSSPPGTGGEDNVELLINDTDTHDDDFVPKVKTDTMQVTPYNAPAGRTDNGVPMKVTYIAPEDWDPVTLKLNVTATSGGLEIRLTDGTTPYPPGGTVFTPNESKEVLLYCTSGCTNVDDITIKATVRAGDVRGTKKATGIEVTNYLFRGSDKQAGGPGAQGELFHGSYPELWYDDARNNPRVGMYLYHHAGVADSVLAQCEAEYTVKPDIQYKKQNKQVEWGIPRNWAGAWWHSGYAQIPEYARPDGKGWQDDNAGGQPGIDKQDLDPQRTNTHIMRIDVVGAGDLMFQNDFRYSEKSKFEHYLEVKIGVKWYVLSETAVCHVITHVVYNAEQGKYVWVAGANKNEVLDGAGGLVGFPANNPPWPEN